VPKTAQQAEARGKAFPLQSSLSLASKNGPAQSDMHMVPTSLLCKTRLRKRDHGGRRAGRQRLAQNFDQPPAVRAAASHPTACLALKVNKGGAPRP